MMDAELELINMGLEAVPILSSVLSGEMTNEQGIPYRQLGLPLTCTLEVAIRLGPIARPLESLLRSELRCGRPRGATALGSLGAVDEESIIELATHLDWELNRQRGFVNFTDLSAESAAALVRLGASEHPSVREALQQSARAAGDFLKYRRQVLQLALRSS